jgi:O-acetyl-ADP-ribose deacetylase (regulator of RNase III)
MPGGEEMDEALIGRSRLILLEGDITRQDTDAIVNAANRHLAGGGGVDGAIHRAGGPEIMAECRRIGGCPTGQAVITTGGRLKAGKVIHTVGPIYQGQPSDRELLTACYRNSLALAKRHGLKTVAFPSISTGAYGYPLDQAAQVALQAISDWLKENPEALEEVRMVLFGSQALAAYRQALERLPG